MQAEHTLTFRTLFLINVLQKQFQTGALKYDIYLFLLHAFAYMCFFPLFKRVLAAVCWNNSRSIWKHSS